MYDKELVDEIKRNHEGIGVVFSAWDCLHAGHCLFLEFARDNCYFLVAGLHTDPKIERPHKNSPVMSLQERRVMLESIKYVDAIVEYDTEEDHLNILLQLNPAVRIFGSDYQKTGLITGKDLNIPVIYHNRIWHGWSSSDLRRRIWEAEEKKRCAE